MIRYDCMASSCYAQIVVRNVRVKEGMLLLLPDYVIVLGGSKGVIEQGEDGADVGADGGQGPLQPPLQARGDPGGAAAATVAPARRQQQQAALPPPPPPAAPMQETDPFGDDDINWADIDLPSYVAPPAAAAPLPTPSRNQHQQILQQSGGSAPPLCVSPGQPGGRDQPAVISLLEGDDKIEVDVPTRPSSSSQTSAVSLHSDSGRGGEGGGGGGNRGRGEAAGGGGRGTLTAPVTFSSPGGSVSAMSSEGDVLDSSSQVSQQWQQQQQQQQKEGDPSSVEEGPYVHLADAQQQQQQQPRYAGQEVSIKGVVTSVTGSNVSKKKGLHITVQIDDGSGSPMEVRLSEAMTRGIIGISSEEFCALFARDPAAATDVTNQARFKLAQIEGVFSVGLPPSTAVSTTEKGGNSNKLPLLTSCTSPTVSDVEALMKICANAIGYELPTGFGEEKKKQEVIDLIDIDDDD